MAERQIGMGEAISATLALLRERLGLSLAAMLAIAAGYSLLDLAGAAGANTVATLAVSVFGQYVFTQELLGDRMTSPLAARRYGALFLVSLLTGLGAVLGLILLIVPGLLLIARWSIATPFVVAEQMGATDAMKASWRATAKSWPALLGIVFIAGAVLIGALVAIVFAAETWGLAETALPIVVPTNLLVGSMTVLAWLFAVAVYELVAGGESSVSQVFS